MTAQEMFPTRPSFTAYLPWEAKSGLWYFEHEWSFNSPHGGGTIKVGFETDFGSVPPVCRGVVDDDDPKALCPFVRHDKRYSDGIGERSVWDQELHDGCIACGMSKVKAWLILRIVRAFGRSHWVQRG